MSSSYFKTLDEECRERYNEKLTFKGMQLPDPLDEDLRKIAFISTRLPNVIIFDIYTYLVEKHQMYTKNAFKNYASLPCYNYVSSGKIKNLICYSNSIGVSVVTADVEGSQDIKKIHLPWIVATHDGEIISGHCTCMAGLGETCSHVAATLIFIKEEIEKPACTSEPCKWNKTSTNAMEVNAENSYFDTLPPEVILKIFGYLSQNQLGQIARVCRQWSVLSRTSALWQKVDVKFFLPCESQNEVLINFLSMLPSRVICMTLDFIRPVGLIWSEWLEFEEICKMLKEKCPHLEQLVLSRATLTGNSPLADLCSLFLREVQIFMLYSCTWKKDYQLDEINVEALGQRSWSNDDVSKIKILGLYNCNIHHFGKIDILKMPHLEQLLVYNTYANDYWFMGAPSFLSQLRILNLGVTRITSRAFRIIQEFGHNLEKLYLCDTGLRDVDFDLNEQMLPKLKSICLSYCGVTCAGIISLIQTCHSLENIYVSESLILKFRVHSFVADNRNESEIVKSIAWDHSHV